MGRGASGRAAGMRRGAFRLAVAGAAGGGLLAGHALDYLIVFSGDDRAHVLAHTGHAYLTRAPLLFAITFVAAVAGALLAGATAPSTATNAPRRTAALLVAVQTSAFLALETLERLMSGAVLGDLLGAVTVVGVVAQIALAVVLAATLRLLFRAGHRIASTLRARFPQPRIRVRRWRPAAEPAHSRLLLGVPTVRGPPILLPF